MHRVGVFAVCLSALLAAAVATAASPSLLEQQLESELAALPALSLPQLQQNAEIESTRIRARRIAASMNLGACGPLCDLDLPGIIAYSGYPVQHHTVTPADNTLTLHMYRIPCGRDFTQCSNGKPRPPVLLQHGLLDSGTTWILNPVEGALGFILADQGYDVWIGNNRGTTYSPCLTDSCWQFTYDEMALYDVPAFVNYILNNTGYSTLSYIGHSEGTTQAFASFSTLPEVAKKINLFVALAPAVLVNNQQSPLVSLLVKLKAVYLFQLFGVKNFLPSSGFLKFIATLFCNGGIFTPICENVIFALCGVDPVKNNDFNASRAEVYLTHTPAGTSVLNMAHWAQAVSSDQFQMYDFGSSGNLKKYGQTSPPAYDLENFSVPTAIYSGGHDFLADPADVMQLLKVLPKSTVILNHYELDYSHLDFVWGMDAKDKIYPSILPLLQQYAEKKTA